MTENSNPYSPPRSNVAEAELERDSVPASKGRRFGTLIVDYIGFMLLSFCIGILVGVLFGRGGVEAMAAMPDILLGWLIMSAYYIFFEGIWGRTPGKWAFGTVVVSEAGTKASLGQVVGRTLCRFIPFEPLSFFGKRGWHDKLSKTQVIMARPS